MPNIRCRCGRLLTYTPEMAGRKARCPRCDTLLDIPATTLALQDELTPPQPPTPRAAAPGPPKSDPFEGKAAPLPCDPDVRERPAVPLAYAATSDKTAAPQPARGPMDDSFRSFAREMGAAALFPFRGNAFISLLCGVVFFTLANYARGAMLYIPMLGVVIWYVAALMMIGYGVGYLMDLVRDSAFGQEDAPDWPDLGDWQENAAKPFFLFLALLIICFGPAAVFQLGRLTEDSAAIWWLAVPGLLYLPMGLLCLSLADGPAGLNPVHVLRAIAARPVRYLILCALLAAATWIEQFVAARIGGLGIAVLARLAGSFVAFYWLLLLGRQMGMFYRTGGEKLKWLAG